MASQRGWGQEQPSLTLERPGRAAWRGMDALVCGPLSCSGAHGATPTAYLVALGAEGVVWVAGTRLTAPATGQLPVVGGALIALGAHHVGQTQAAAALLITGHVPPGPQDTAVTACRRGAAELGGRLTENSPPEIMHQEGINLGEETGRADSSRESG